MARILIDTTTPDPLQVSGYLYLLPRERLRKLCKARKLPAGGKRKGDLVDVLAADLTRTGGTIALTIHIKPEP